MYDIEKIFSLFYEYDRSENLILTHYVEHLKEIKEAVGWQEKPKSNNGYLDFLRWESYFKKVGKEIIEERNYDAGGVWKAGQFPYECLVFRYNEIEPYLEIRSRDCVSYDKDDKNPFIARLLFYGVENCGLSFAEIEEKQNKLKEFINENSLFEIKHVKKGKDKFSKQFGVYSTLNIDTDEKFVEELNKCADFFDKIMMLWNS